ncbi:UNVERIFIED_CONTAM: Retrovirus-related Pol polyprotein from transposon [Sesamum latifolium]|uniref:Retrovirus-related Pol polyprotein from transposon n=1 Tax=Sesamum latifolium TaxID=2727402 RepID=A0AAW2TK51_9LAMI
MYLRVSSIDYLGHVISAVGVAADPTKLEAIAAWPPPASLTALQAFLGLTGYYRRFVRHYATLASPLTDLLKGPKFHWSLAAAIAFESLKAVMLSLPVLGWPDFSQPFNVTTDASRITVGAVLSQHRHPIAFFCKKMNPKMQSSAYECEMFAITEAVRKWRQYLLGRRFNIYTDQKSLKALLIQIVQTPAQQRWLTKLLGYDFPIHYIPGRDNRVADALSQNPLPTAFVVRPSPPPPRPSIVVAFFQYSPLGLFQRSPLYPELRRAPLFAFGRTSYHSDGGHSGVRGTYARLTASFYWPKMLRDIKNSSKPALCARASITPPSHNRELCNLCLPPARVWEDITMDFIMNLPSSGGKMVIWVVVDRLSKYAHLVGLPTYFTAASLAAVFSEAIYKLHGMPKSIVSDRDRIFLSHFWRELFCLCGTTLKFSSAYHPQTDGQIEVLNRVLETFLRCFVNKALYGRSPPTLTHYSADDSPMLAVDTHLRQRQDILASVKYHLARAHHRMKLSADLHRWDVDFKVGDWALLRLHPYRQVSVSRRPSQKLSRRFFGPFRILRKTRVVAYELELPVGAKIHPVFHVSLLKPYHGPDPTGYGVLPQDLWEMERRSNLENTVTPYNSSKSLSTVGMG